MLNNFRILIYLATAWQVVRFMADANAFWGNEQNFIMSIFWVVGTIASLVTQHGKAAVRRLSSSLRTLSATARKWAHILESFHSNWDDLVAGREAKKKSSGGEAAPIQETGSTSLRPVFPVSVVIVLVVALSAAIAAFVVGLGEPRQSNLPLLSDVKIEKKKEDRAATFADRFTLPNDCSGCGGPVVDMVPMPRPNPLRLKVSQRARR